MKILIFSILFLVSNSIIIDPINSSCIEDSMFSIIFDEQLKVNLHQFNLDPFSQSVFEVDLRHILTIPKTDKNESCFTLKALIYQNQVKSSVIINNIEANVNKYIFYVDKSSDVSLYFQIEDGYDSYKYLLQNSISFKVIKQNKRIPTQSSSFLFVISNLDAINLPFNRPNVQAYNGYYINKLPYNLSAADGGNSTTSNSYWTTFNSFAIPYIPYVSNCKGEGDKMFLSQLMQNQNDCNLISLQQTRPIDQFKFGSVPVADTCLSKRECVYDQKPSVSIEFPYWFTLGQGKTLFSITKNKVSYEQYELKSNIEPNQLVPCIINQSKGTNSSAIYPLNVKLTLEYYQVTKIKKTMISCTVTFSLYMQSFPNFPYQFQVQTKPLNHTYIMLSFGFEWYVYMIVFVIIGVISNFQNLILWLFHSVVSAKRKISLIIYVKVIVQIIKGTFIALIFCIILVFSIAIIMNGKLFSLTIYPQNLNSSVPRVFWDYMNNLYITDYESDVAIKFRSGRMGLSFLVAGTVILFYTSKFFIGCEKNSKQYDQYQIMGRIFKPREWNKGKFIFGTYIYICIQFFFIYFAYSTVYSQNIWTFIVLIKIIQIIMQQITLSIYEDLLPCLPLKVITEITAYMNTLSADNLYDFLFSFLIDVAITMIEKAYFPQVQNIIFDKINEKMVEFLKFYAHLTNDSDEEVKEVSKEKQEQEQQNQFVLMNSQAEEVKFFNSQQDQIYYEDNKINLRVTQEVNNLQELIKHKLSNYRKFQNTQNVDSYNNEVYEQKNVQKSQEEVRQETSLFFQILLDNILLFFTFLLQPFVILVYWITYDESGVLNSYGISKGVVILYLLSAIVVAIFTITNMILIFHLLQSYLQVDFDEKIDQLLKRFFNRQIFWKAHDQDINTAIQTAFRGADHYCLSWQFFFILAIYISSMVLVMVGITTMINAGYNPFKDPIVTLVIFFWCIFTISSIWLIQKLAYKFNIDGWRSFDSDSKNTNAIIDLNQKVDINKRNQNTQFTNHPFALSQTSQQELFGSKMLLNRSKKTLVRINEQKNIDEHTDDHRLSSQNSDSQNSDLSDETLNIKISTICKKLEQKFKNDKFNIDYFQRNKEFVKQNIERILPLIRQLPEINEYRIPTNSFFLADSNGKKQNKTYDPLVLQMISKWKLKTDLMTQQRQRKGRQLQKQLSSCSFCFSSWGVYYGNGGMCLKCSSQIQKIKKNI